MAKQRVVHKTFIFGAVYSAKTDCGIGIRSSKKLSYSNDLLWVSCKRCLKMRGKK